MNEQPTPATTSPPDAPTTGSVPGADFDDAVEAALGKDAPTTGSVPGADVLAWIVQHPGWALAVAVAALLLLIALILARSWLPRLMRPMLGLLTGLLSLAAMVLAAAFAISNQHEVAFELAPFVGRFVLPAYLAVLAPFVVGFFCGALALWVREIAARRALGRERRRVLRLERENGSLRQPRPAAGGQAALSATAEPRMIARHKGPRGSER